MVIERHDVNFPSELILRTMIDGDWKISSVIETAELRWRNYSSVGGSCFWFGIWSFIFWSEQGRSVTSKTSSFFESVAYKNSKLRRVQIKFKLEASKVKY